MTSQQIFTRFGIVTLITFAAVIVLSVVFSTFFGIDASSGLGIATVILPALDAGTNYVKKTGEGLESARMWRLSVFFTIMNLVIGMMMMAVVSVISPIGFGAILAQIGLGTFGVVVLVVCAVYVLMARLFLGMGVKQELKRL